MDAGKTGSSGLHVGYTAFDTLSVSLFQNGVSHPQPDESLPGVGQGCPVNFRVLSSLPTTH